MKQINTGIKKLNDVIKKIIELNKITYRTLSLKLYSVYVLTAVYGSAFFLYALYCVGAKFSIAAICVSIYTVAYLSLYLPLGFNKSCKRIENGKQFHIFKPDMTIKNFLINSFKFSIKDDDTKKFKKLFMIFIITGLMGSIFTFVVYMFMKVPTLWNVINSIILFILCLTTATFLTYYNNLYMNYIIKSFEFTTNFNYELTKDN